MTIDLGCETIVWYSAKQLPDSDTTVLVWDGREWFSGYHDGDRWIDSTGMPLQKVTHWAEPMGPV